MRPLVLLSPLTSLGNRKNTVGSLTRQTASTVKASVCTCVEAMLWLIPGGNFWDTAEVWLMKLYHAEIILCLLIGQDQDLDTVETLIQSELEREHRAQDETHLCAKLGGYRTTNPIMTWVSSFVTVIFRKW